MNKKKLTIIVCSVLAVLVVGLLVNHFFNWPIDSRDASGDNQPSHKGTDQSRKNDQFHQKQGEDGDHTGNGR